MEYINVSCKAIIRSCYLLDHVYIKNTIWEKFDMDVSISNIYFSNHDAFRIKLSNKQTKIDFQITQVYLQ